MTVFPQRVIHLPVDTVELYGTFNDDCSCLLTGSDGPMPQVQVWDLSTEKCLRSLFGHIEPITALAWSKNQVWVASGSQDGAVRIWNLKTGLCCHLFQHRSSVRSVEFSLDGMHVLAGVGDGTISLWDLRAGLLVRVFKGHSDGIYHAVFDSHQRRVLSGSRDGTVRLWECHSGNCLLKFGGAESHIQCVAWHPFDPAFLSCSNEIRLWNAESGKCLETLRGHDDTIRSVAWSPSCSSILSASHDRTVRIWCAERINEKCRLVGHRACVVTASWKTESTVYSCDSSGAVCCWSLAI
jgi:WD40 repeat protein